MPINVLLEGSFTTSPKPLLLFRRRVPESRDDEATQNEATRSPLLAADPAGLFAA